MNASMLEACGGVLGFGARAASVGEEGGAAEEAGEMSVWECVRAGCKGAAAEAAAVAVAVAVGGAE